MMNYSRMGQDDLMEQEELGNQLARPRRAQPRTDPTSTAQPATSTQPAAASGIQADPTGQPTEQPSQSTSPFESENQDWRGYMKEATRAYAPTLQGIKDEGEREAAVEAYIRSLIPEVEKRGGKINDVRKEKIQTPDGRWIDLYRDITDGTGSGAAEAQWLEEDPNAPSAGVGAAFGGMAPGGVSSLSGIESLVPTDTNTYQTLQARLAQILGGPEALTQEALAQQMMR